VTLESGDKSGAVFAVIPARKGSKRVVRKNVRDFRGQTLLEWSIKAALATPEISKVIVSTDDEEAIEIAKQFPVIVLPRPTELSTDTSDTFDVLRHVVLKQLTELELYPELLVLLQVTSPLREKDLISKGLKKLMADSKSDRLIELNRSPFFTGSVASGYWVSDFPENTRSQDLPFVYFPSGRLYIYRIKETIAKNDPDGLNTCFLLGDYSENINIDEESDFEKLEYVYSMRIKKFSYLLRN